MYTDCWLSSTWRVLADDIFNVCYFWLRTRGHQANITCNSCFFSKASPKSCGRTCSIITWMEVTHLWNYQLLARTGSLVIKLVLIITDMVNKLPSTPQETRQHTFWESKLMADITGFGVRHKTWRKTQQICLKGSVWALYRGMVKGCQRGIMIMAP